MEHEKITRWLDAKIRTGALLRTLGAAVALLGGLALLYVYFWVMYCFVWFVFDWWLPLEHSSRVTISGFGIAVLFVLNVITDRRELENVSSDGIYSLSEFKWERTKLRAKAASILLLIGPQLLTLSLRLIMKTKRLLSLDLENCALALAMLAERGSRISIEEITSELPRITPEEFFPQLRLIPGVLFLGTEPPALTLNDQLKEELYAL